MIVYRFVGEEELGRIKLFRNDERVNRLGADIAGQQLVSKMKEFIKDPLIGEKIFNHTVVGTNGGQIGPRGPEVVSMAKSVSSLINSTDDAVQYIVRSAQYIVEFDVPPGAILAGGSDLSESETEVLVPNIPWALAARIINISNNPHRRGY